MMMYPQVCGAVLLLLVVASFYDHGAVTAWTPTHSHRQQHRTTALTLTKKDPTPTVAAAASMASLAWMIAALSNPSPAVASVDAMTMNPISTSVLVAAETKILDMSLPSYDALKDTKASVENVPGLAIPASELASKGPIGLSTYSSSEAVRASAPSSESSSLSDNKIITTLLPSVGKAGPSSK
jgi:hypothetical protein